MSRLWYVGRAFLLVSLVPLAVALWLLFAPISNPGVQECGASALLLVGGDGNTPVVAEGRPTEELERLRAQATCTERADERIDQAIVAGAIFLACAFTGAMLGIIDDRLALRHAPRFETLLREGPEP